MSGAEVLPIAAAMTEAAAPATLGAMAASPWLTTAPAFAGEGLAALSTAAPAAFIASPAAPTLGASLMGLADKAGPVLEKGAKAQAVAGMFSPKDQNKQVSAPQVNLGQYQSMQGLLNSPAGQMQQKKLRNLGLLG